MARILVYNNDTNRMETYYRGENEPMPYNTKGTLKVKEFRASSKANTLWTEKRVMQAWNSQRYLYGAPIPVGFAFKRPYEGGHFAGTAFDVAQRLSNSQRNAIRNVAISSEVWSYVEPANLTPTWVHFDKRRGTPTCSTGGFPLLRQGSRGAYVAIAQDDLNTLGYRTGGLDGVFGNATRSAVANYQIDYGLASDGIIGCNTWRSLQEDVVGMGKSATTID